MKKQLTLALCSLLLLMSCATGAWSVTITTHGGGSPSVVRPSQPGSQPRPSSKKTGIAQLDLPSQEKGRLSQAMELARLTGMQAKVALDELALLEGKEVPAGEIRAKLVYAQETLAAMEKAGKRLEDSAKLVRMTWDGRFGPEDRLAALEEIFQVMPAFAGFDGGYGFVTPEQVIQQEFQKIGRGAKQTFENAMSTVEAGGRAVKNFASYLGNAVKSGVGKITGAVASVHHRIGNVVGQKNWATIMAGTKFTAAIVGSGVALVVAVPATATAAGALTAVAIYTAANVGAGVSFANDISTIQGYGGPDDLDNALTRINQGTAVIGLVTSGSGSEVLVNVIGISGNEIIGTTDLQHMTPEELSGYLNERERKEFLEKLGARPEYRAPTDTDGGEGEGGSSGGGCGDGC
nr:hypothetical protein [uncultured Dethiosulfovibrio sp.]